MKGCVAMVIEVPWLGDNHLQNSQSDLEFHMCMLYCSFMQLDCRQRHSFN